MSKAYKELLAWSEAQILMEKSQMICPVTRDENERNSGSIEQLYELRDKQASDMADELIYSQDKVADAADYPMFFPHLTLALTASSNEERLSWLGRIRDAVHARIKSAAREELRRADLQGEEP